ncbi:MAG: Holliday junction resolvase RuvX [Phycisphaerales bacterium]|nr:Holliday junction resolvase RuvX [Phycisphaerales bacterium]
MRYLCLDIGDKRTGAALGDDETWIVSPLGIIEVAAESALLDRLALLIEEHEPDELVVGLPLNMDGTRGPQAKKIAALVERLAEAVLLPIHLQDERLSSFAADEAMARTGLTHKQKKQRRDALAAAAILRGFFESRGAAASRTDRDAPPTLGPT